jgi:3-phosphoshikimate 1-carboxyvinyltransferase
MQKYDVLLYPKIQINDTNINIPSSKSYTNRAILIASISDGTSKISNLLRSDDTKYMILALQNLGINIIDNDDFLIIEGNNGVFKNIINKELFCGIAGTTSRFLTGLSILIDQDIKINGENKILVRPIGDLVSAMQNMGIKIEYNGIEESLPITIYGDKNIINISNTVNINGEISSQFISALLMIAPRLPDGLIINVRGNQVSKSYIDITIDIMKTFGIIVINDNYKKYIIKNQEYQAQNYIVEGDWSSASYFLGAQKLLQNNIKINNINHNSIQGDVKFINILKNFSNTKINMEQMPDTAMTIMILAAITTKKTIITGLSTLKNKECDRIEVSKQELAKFGIKCKTTKNSIVIYGQTFNNKDIIEVETHEDHRVAMAFSLIGTQRKILIKNAQVVNKSFPRYWQELEKIINIRYVE